MQTTGWKCVCTTDWQKDSCHFCSTYNQYSRVVEHVHKGLQDGDLLSAEEDSCCVYHNGPQCSVLQGLPGVHPQLGKGTTLLISN